MFKVITINRHRMQTDGKGVTSLVALLGCPLKCKYCINMDILKPEKYKTYSAEELWEELMIDYCYFIGTGGGITFGGGETLLWANEILEFMDIVPDGVNVNIETSLNVSFAGREEIFEALVKKLGGLIVDIKTWNRDIYEQYTELNNYNTVTNLSVIEKLGLQDKCKIRIPIIPEYTTEEDAKRDAKVLEDRGYKDIEIFPYIIRDYMTEN